MLYILPDCVCVHCVQNALKNMEDECTHLQMMYQSSQEELEQLVERSEEHVQEIRELNDKFQVCLVGYYVWHWLLWSTVICYRCRD